MHPFLAMAMIMLAIIPLVWRRLYPIAVLLFVTVLIIVLQVLDIPEMNFTGVASIIAIFSAAAYGGLRRNLICIICIIAILLSLTYQMMFGGTVVFPSSDILFRVYSLIWNGVLLMATWWFGNTLRMTREQTLQLKDHAEQLTREREENARRAVLDERVRIARELHDVLAHHVSVMGIQAGAARQVLRQYPEKALNSLNLIETSSRRAVAELYRLLGFLRDENQVEVFTSQPGLQQLEKLVADIRAAGLPVEVIITGEKCEIPEAVDLSAYRIVEEALTNTLKHSGPAKAIVALDYQKDILLLDITDNGHGNVSMEDRVIRGKGLIGMRERVNLLKGEFWAGDAQHGGYCVRAKLPLSESE
ncbi:sensor histidine kinase [Chloroflexota bacterium]